MRNQGFGWVANRHCACPDRSPDIEFDIVGIRELSELVKIEIFRISSLSFGEGRAEGEEPSTAECI